mgnify:CR=1 FL=1
MAGTEKRNNLHYIFASVSCRRLATDFRNHLLDYMPHPRKLRLPRMGIFLQEIYGTDNDKRNNDFA